MTTLFPVGTWKAKGVEAALGDASSSGNETIAIGFVALEGEPKGRQITWYGYFTEKTFDRTIESMRYCGWEGNDLSRLESCTRNEVYIVVEHEEDQEGEMRARVRWVNSGGGVALKNRMDVGSAKAFAERMKGRVLALSQNQQSQTPQSPNAGRRPQQQASHVVTNQPDDDIPF